MRTRLFKFIFGLCIIVATLSWLLLIPLEVVARVGGGQSYGGGRSGGSDGGGSGGGGSIVWLIFEAIRMLVYLTIEYPIIGIPLDIIVILGVVYFFKRRKSTVSFSSIVRPPNVPGVGAQEPATRSLARLRQVDPNVSEIVFTDFAYALYGKAHDARGHGAAALDLLSPYLSENARNTLLNRNPAGITEVKGIIVGSLRIARG